MTIKHEQFESPISVEFVGKLGLYRISGTEDALLNWGIKLYKKLGEAELTEEQCKEMLQRGRELRPRGGIFGIIFTRGVLMVDNRNMQGDEAMNKILKEAVESEVK